MEADRERLRATVLDRQRAALTELCNRPGCEGARAILDRLDQLDPVTVDDAIADLRAGRFVPLPEADAPDLFDTFFPAVVRPSNSTTIARGQSRSALAGGQNLGPLPFADLDSQTRKRGQHLVETWGAAENDLRQNQPERLSAMLARLFGLIGLAALR
ncbi:hypothetical protein ruthe_02290 [Rubellimicrobium thermophilum DSM 16684]|uniref:Uncharacterized protein n=1 Tax=Rubellimicrobium thermophilum DSM 16684 TaxID=1123069 RepID=S9SDQ7_9RHOB|nr:hypothetical protein [Rubellimicrobium thermophilum]EPX84384.1 hypothetical protein ruthe_02290 [Rubellimicrobium thermophilum DSM 16684]